MPRRQPYQGLQLNQADAVPNSPSHVEVRPDNSNFVCLIAGLLVHIPPDFHEKHLEPAVEQYG